MLRTKNYSTTNEALSCCKLIFVPKYVQSEFLRLFPVNLPSSNTESYNFKEINQKMTPNSEIIGTDKQKSGRQPFNLNCPLDNEFRLA